MESSVQHFPVTHKECSVVIKGNKTDMVISGYDDHFLVIATQIGSMGTILHARKEESMSIHPTFNVSVIFGKRDEPMLVACARQIIEHIRYASIWHKLYPVITALLLIKIPLKCDYIRLIQAIGALSWSSRPFFGNIERSSLCCNCKSSMVTSKLPCEL